MAAGADCLLAGFMQRRRGPGDVSIFVSRNIGTAILDYRSDTCCRFPLLFCEDSRPADSFVYAGSEINDR